MRSEDKAVDGLDLERAEKRRESTLEREDEEEVPELAGDEVRDATPAQSSELVAAMRQILERQHLVVNDLSLPERELRALDALKAAVEGRDAQLDQFVYASDRSDLLEQALAILQPNIGDLTGLHDVIRRVADLRHGLKGLEDAQDELLEGHEPQAVAKADADTDDKPDDTSLTGPERAPEPERPTTLGDPAELAAQAKKPWWRRPFGG